MSLLQKIIDGCLDYQVQKGIKLNEFVLILDEHLCGPDFTIGAGDLSEYIRLMLDITALGKSLNLYDTERVFNDESIQSLSKPDFAAKYLDVFKAKRLEAVSRIKQGLVS